MGRFETENQATQQQGPQRAVRTDYLRKGSGLQRNRMLRTQHRQRQSAAGGQAVPFMMGQRMAQAGGQTGGAMMTQGQQLRQMKPLRHWGYEAAIVCQPDIDQKPSFKRRYDLSKPRVARKRIHRLRRGVAWDIPVYNKTRHERGGVSWTIALDADCYAEIETTKKSKAKQLLKRFTGSMKRFGRLITGKQPKESVRQQRRIVARKRGQPFMALGSRPQAPKVEARRVERMRGSGMPVSKDAAFTAPRVAQAQRPVRSGHWNPGTEPLMRQAPEEDLETVRKWLHRSTRRGAMKKRAQVTSKPHPLATKAGSNVIGGAQHLPQAQQVRTG
jgi:hypothetical protein